MTSRIIFGLLVMSMSLWPLNWHVRDIMIHCNKRPAACSRRQTMAEGVAPYQGMTKLFFCVPSDAPAGATPLCWPMLTTASLLPCGDISHVISLPPDLLEMYTSSHV
jgi:hypothetical protein